LWLLVIALVVGSTIGLFYYLRIIAMMAAPLPETAAEPLPMPAMPAASATLAALVLLLVGLGVDPAPLMHLLETTVAQLPALLVQAAK
jgi:NADH-quinone oxidoreductase subunit N